MGFLGVCLDVVGGGNLAISTHTYVVSENVHFSSKAFLILLMHFAKNHCFFGQNTTFTRSNSVRVALEIF